jgi:hypothetical protein
MTTEQVLKRLRALVVEMGSQRAVAKRFGVSDAYLSDVLYQRRLPGPKILSGLGLERDDTYRRAK